MAERTPNFRASYEASAHLRERFPHPGQQQRRFASAAPRIVALLHGRIKRIHVDMMILRAVIWQSSGSPHTSQNYRVVNFVSRILTRQQNNSKMRMTQVEQFKSNRVRHCNAFGKHTKETPLYGHSGGFKCDQNKSF